MYFSWITERLVDGCRRTDAVTDSAHSVLKKYSECTSQKRSSAILQMLCDLKRYANFGGRIKHNDNDIDRSAICRNAVRKLTAVNRESYRVRTALMGH